LSLDAEAATLKPAVPQCGLWGAQVGILDAQVVMLFYFFRNMQRIKINLCTEVAAFFP